jgi:hypothetical protein
MSAMRQYRRLAVPVLFAVALSLMAGCAAPKQAAQAARTDPVTARLITEVTTVPQATLNTAAKGAMMTGLPPSKVTGSPLTVAGKPELFYDSVQYCPYCAAQNWPLIVALSRFGTFTGLTPIRSTAWSDGIANIPPLDTWSFYHSTYTSRYLAFVPVEERSNELITPKANPANGGSYRVLQKLTPAQLALVRKYESRKQVPFLDFGNKLVLAGALYPPQDLLGVGGKSPLTWSQIAASLRDPNSQAGESIRNAAVFLTADLCVLTGNQPRSVCTPPIRALENLP